MSEGQSSKNNTYMSHVFSLIITLLLTFHFLFSSSCKFTIFLTNRQISPSFFLHLYSKYVSTEESLSFSVQQPFALIAYPSRLGWGRGRLVRASRRGLDARRRLNFPFPATPNYLQIQSNYTIHFSHKNFSLKKSTSRL